MMRALLIVVGFVTLAFMELRTPPRVAEAAKAAPDRFAQLTIGTSLASSASQKEDRGKGDRLDIAHANPEPRAEQILFAERLPQPDVKPQPAAKAAVPEKKAKSETKRDTKTASKTNTKTAERSKHAAHDNKASTAKPKPKPAQIAAKNPAIPVRPRSVSSKSASNKPASEIKSCRPNVFERLLNTLNLPSGCET